MSFKKFLFLGAFTVVIAALFLTSISVHPMPVHADTVQVDCSGTSASPTAVDEASLDADDVTFADAGGDGYCILDADLSAGSVVVNTGVIITHGTLDTNGVDITTSGDFTLNGDLNVSGRGYGNGSGTGTGTGGYRGGGGGYGGEGGDGLYGGAGGSSYGEPKQPNLLGSGGVAYNSGGNGGGIVKLVVGGTLSVNGNIYSNGNDAPSDSGAGSGGSIWLDAGTLAGSGNINANGGNAGHWSQSVGSGGRIAVYYTTDSSTIISGNKMTAFSGSSSWKTGGAGTVFYMSDADTNGHLIVDNNNLGSVSGDNDGDNTTQSSTAVQTFDSVAVRSGAFYVVPNGYTLALTTDGSLAGGGTDRPSITIESGAEFDAGSETFTVSDIDFVNNGSMDVVRYLTVDNTNFTHNGIFSAVGEVISLDYANNGVFIHNGGGLVIDDLVIGDTGTFILAASEVYDSLTVENTGTFSQKRLGPISITSVTVESGGTLTHEINNGAKNYELNIDATSFNLQSGGVVDVTGKGFRPDQGTGKGTYHWAGTGSGGGYGGVGGSDIYGSAVGTTYGSETLPTDLGSGGALGGAGGGAVRITADGTLQVNGTIIANGSSGAYWDAGGSGGSAYLDAGTLAGSGSITAHGGAGSGRGGSGGGGRIAVYYITDNSTISKTASGGTGGGGSGADGTVYFVRKNPYATNFPVGSGTTDFSQITDYTSITNMKLANSNGSIQWTGADVNAEAEDYDSYLTIGNGFVSMDISNLDDTAHNDSGSVSGFNARVSIGVDGCDTYTIYYADGYYTSLNDIKTNGQVCNVGTTPACTNISCSGGTLSFDVPHFDGYGGEGASAEEDVTTTVGVGNVAPVITVTPSDGGSAGGTGTGDTAGNPTNVGSDITFTATAKDINTDQYFMAICKTDAVTSGGASAPSCDGGAWAIDAEVDSDTQASVSYTALEVNSESNDWYTFTCDKVSGGLCFPANGLGDEGYATGTVTFADVPAEEDDITIDATQIRFDPNGDGCVGAGSCLNVSSSEDGQDVAELVAALSFDGSYGVARANVVYMFADSKGAAGNSIDLTIGTCANCSVSGASLSGGSDNNASPFKVNHAGTFGSVVFTDDGGGGTIEPGETLRFTIPQASLADADTDGTQDTLNVYICSGESDMGGVTTTFDYAANTCTNGTLLCSDTAVNPTSEDATCDDTQNIISVPTAHGSYDVKVYVEDNHDFPATGTATQTFTVEDVAPTSASYSSITAPSLAAGGSDTVAFSVDFEDPNGDNDVTGVEGVLFDDDAVSNACTASENDCYIDATCTLTDVSTPGSGKTATGTDENLGADCSVTFWFNANASANWEAHAKATDGLGQDISFDNTNINLTVAALQGIDVVEASIAYGAVAIGGTSNAVETSMGNVGNQVLDLYVDGDQMCTDFPTCGGAASTKIAVGQQKWHHNSSSFDWDSAATGAGPYALVDIASGTGDAGGCLNRDIDVRFDHSATTTNESIFWKLRIPSSQSVGAYTGQTTFATTSSGTCITGGSY